MIFRTIAVTALLALIAAVATIFTAGANGLLFLAILGPAALALAPVYLALALPAGAFGGVLLTHAERMTEDAADEDANREALRLAVFAMLVSLLMVGWLVPLAGGLVEEAFSPYVDAAAPVAAVVSPARLPLDELLVGIFSGPGAGEELLRRGAWIAPSFLLPLLAAALTVVRRRWTYSGAAAATLGVFAVSARLAFGALP